MLGEHFLHQPYLEPYYQIHPGACNGENENENKNKGEFDEKELSMYNKMANMYITYLSSEGKKNNLMSSTLASGLLKYIGHTSSFETISK